MTLWLLSAVLLWLFSTWLAALGLALYRFSPSALQHYRNERNKSEAGEWLTDHLEACTLGVSLLRTLSRVAFYVVILIDVVGYGENITLAWPDFVLAGAVAAVALWISAVLARAAARYAPMTLVSPVLPLLHLLTFIFTPAAKIMWVIDEAVRRLSGVSKQEAEQLSQVELLQRIEDSQLQGELDEEAAVMLENVVEFRSTDVGEIMTPRTDMEGIELTDDLDAIREFIDKAGHSRIPVYVDNLDHIVGILYVKDLVPYLGRDVDDFKLRPILRTPVNVPDSKPVSELLRHFQKSEVHLAIVIDEYGGTAGLVTIEDALEEIVGEIYDEHEPDDEEPPTCNLIDERTAEVDGRYHIDDLNEQFTALNLPEDEEFDTVGGFLLARLGHVPEVGETFETDHVRLTALAATPTQIEKIGIELLETAPVNGQTDAPK